MSAFKACLKKDMLEMLRTKKLWIFLGLSVAMMAFAAVMFLFMDAVVADGSSAGLTQEELDSLLAIFEANYLNSIMFFSSSMNTYFVLVVIILIAKIIPNEIKNKQWINPISAGIKPQQIIASKIIVTVGTVFVTALIGCVLHLIFTVCCCAPEGVTIGTLIYSYVMLLVYILFFAVCAISLSAICKRTWLTILILLGSLILLPDMLSAVVLEGGYTLGVYTPFLFGSESMVPMYATFTPTVWVVSVLLTVGISAGLIVWAILSNKIKSE